MPNIKSQKDRVVQAKKEAMHNKLPSTATLRTRTP